MYSLRSDPDRNFRDPGTKGDTVDIVVDMLAGKFLKIHSHQLFVRNFMNPNTPYMRLHLQHATGTGKTLASITIAQEFIRVYHKLYAAQASKMQAGRRNYGDLDRLTPTVFVFGFGGTKAAFVRELLKHPEFGFVTHVEKEELLKRRKAADAGLPDDIKHLKGYHAFLKKRIANKYRGGFYKFFGYDEFVNRLFLGEDIKPTDLEAITQQRLRAGENVTLEQVFAEYIAAGKIRVNRQLLAMMENSLIIGDEIHNTYNMHMKNNRGVALQYVLDTVPSLRFLGLSATPINNSPTEVVEVLNYLLPVSQKITKKEFFANGKTLLPGKLEELGRLSRGRISFLQDSNIKYFPRRTFVGEDLILPGDAGMYPRGSPLPYLKFTECPMSQLHQATYVDYIRNATTGVSDDTDTDMDADGDTDVDMGADTYHSIAADGYAIYDIVFPNPDSDSVGMFRSSEIRNKIALAPSEWKDSAGIHIKKFSATNSIIVGDFLRHENIGKYSTKCVTLLDTISTVMLGSGGDADKCKKIMVYHDRVKTSGVLLTQELLRANGFIDETSEPVENTLCCICGQAMGGHARGGDASTGDPSAHEFRPARFVVAHSDVDKVTMDQSLARFNHPDNSHGLNYMILIGSKIVKESFDFKSIQVLIILSLPTSIPTFIQIIGRSVRNNSHIDLPVDQRRVDIYILVSTVNTKYPSLDPVSPEIYRYADKIADYVIIQNIEREFNRNAIDAQIHRDTIMSPDLLAAYFPPGATEPVASIGNLYFDPVGDLPYYKPAEIRTTTFNAYKYFDEEVRTIAYLIKRLFMLSPVWTYDDLWAAVRRPPFGLESNPAMFAEGNFIIALHNFVATVAPIVSTARTGEMTEASLIDRLFDYTDRYVYIGGHRYRIEQVEKYYIRFPVDEMPDNPLNVIHADRTQYTRDKERSMIRDLPERPSRVLADAETYMRQTDRAAGIRIPIDRFVRESKASANYTTQRDRFIVAYVGKPAVTTFLTDFSARFQAAFLEEAIVHTVRGSTDASTDAATMYQRIIELLDGFRVIVTMKEMMKYRDVVKQYKNGVPTLPPDTPMGYASAKSVRLFDPAADKWHEVSKVSLNRHVTYKENDIIVGYLETAEDHMRFKLRRPIQQIKADINRDIHARKASKSEAEGGTARTTVGDTRLIERGIVCGTKSKRDLLRIIASLGVSASKLDKADLRVRGLCAIIRDRLIESEMKERKRDSKHKFLYSWWDEAVDLTA
jgi:hypothetical protein